MTDNISVAFAGPADVTPEAVKALLNDYLGFGPDDADGYPQPSDREIELIFPVRADHFSQGLKNVLAWSEYADLPFVAVTDKAETLDAEHTQIVADGAGLVQVTNVNAKIVDMLSHAKGEGVLVLLWGEGDEGGDEDTEMLLDLALAENVKVIDLTAGLDDMVFSEEEPEPDPEPEPAAKPARGRRAAAKPDTEKAEESVEKPARRGRSRVAEEPLVQPEEDLVDEPVKDEPAKPARRARKPVESARTNEELAKGYHEALAAAKEAAGQPAISQAEREIMSPNVEQTSGPGIPMLDMIKGTLTSVWLFLEGQSASVSQVMLLDTIEETPLAAAVREALEALESVVATVPLSEFVPSPKRGRGRPRKEPDASDTTAYFEDGDGIIRVTTRGRPRRGLTRIELTALEVEAKTEAGLVDED